MKQAQTNIGSNSHSNERSGANSGTRQTPQPQQINPGHERTQANLAVALIAMDQVPSAVALLRQNMGEAPAATMVGFALAQRGELDQAKKYFSQALDADASNQPAAEALVL